MATTSFSESFKYGSRLFGLFVFVLLVGGGGIGVWAYRALDLAEPITGAVDVPPPDEISVTPAQRAAARYVPVAGLLFTAQTLVGGLLAHYHVERTGFYGIFEALGIDIVSLIPFAAGRTWHVNLAVLWISTLWLGGGLFLPGLFADRDPPFQAAGVTGLLGALVIASAAIGSFAALLVAGVYHTGETARGAMYLYPFLLLPVAAALRRIARDERERWLLAAAVFGQSLLMQLVGGYLW